MVSKVRALRYGVLLAAWLGAGCYDLQKLDPGRPVVELTPDAEGHVSVPELGIRGRWYVYGDQYDIPRRCVTLGRHFPEHCSSIFSPDHLPNFAVPADGGMCVTGEAALAIPCLKPTQIECLVPGSPAGDDGGNGSPQIVTVDCTCDEPSCMPQGAICNCPAVNPLPCDGSKADYSNIWGAGIGLDFSVPFDPDDPNEEHRDPLARQPWDPAAHGVTGIAFDFSLSKGLDEKDFVRVEFPILLAGSVRLPLAANSTGPDWIGTASLKTEDDIADPGAPYPDSNDGTTDFPSEEHPSGSPFWEAGTDWGNAPSNGKLTQGHNVLRFSDVRPPPFSQIDKASSYSFYKWDPAKLLGLQFHVPTRNTQSEKFSFCISNLTFVRD